MEWNYPPYVLRERHVVHVQRIVEIEQMRQASSLGQKGEIHLSTKNKKKKKKKNRKESQKETRRGSGR